MPIEYNNVNYFDEEGGSLHVRTNGGLVYYGPGYDEEEGVGTKLKISYNSMVAVDRKDGEILEIETHRNIYDFEMASQDDLFCIQVDLIERAPHIGNKNRGVEATEDAEAEAGEEAEDTPVEEEEEDSHLTSTRVPPSSLTDDAEKGPVAIMQHPEEDFTSMAFDRVRLGEGEEYGDDEMEEQAFEDEPVDFHNEAEKSSLLTSLPPNQKLLWSAVACLAVIAIILSIASLVVTIQDQNKGSNNMIQDPANLFQPSSADCPPLEDISNRRLQDILNFEHVGCFTSVRSSDNKRLESTAIAVLECADHCKTPFFGIVEKMCFCHTEVPDKRLSMGSCGTVEDCEGTDVPVDQRMDTYFNGMPDEECGQEIPSAIRHVLVGGDDVPIGFDILQNSFSQSPFELYKLGCGTNMYSIQTEISEELRTSVQTVTAFALDKREHLRQSLFFDVTMQAGSAALSVSGTRDKEQLNAFQSTGADSKESKVFTSTGVKRLAEVTLNDFDNKKHFVTFTPEFRTLIREYRDGGYARAKADEIIEKYGQFILTRGIVGGYIQYRGTTSKLMAERGFASDQESRLCFETAMVTEASFPGFASPTRSGQCTEEAKQEFRLQQSIYETESKEATIVGGKDWKASGGDDFEVLPETATLLKSRNQYPANDNGIQLRVLSDFLEPSKVSPLEARRSQIWEDQFGEIQANLEKHIVEYLEEKAKFLEGCSDCEVPYLESSQDGLECQCYNPQKVYTASPTPAPTYPPTACPLCKKLVVSGVYPQEDGNSVTFGESDYELVFGSTALGEFSDAVDTWHSKNITDPVLAHLPFDATLTWTVNEDDSGNDEYELHIPPLDWYKATCESYSQTVCVPKVGINGCPSTGFKLNFTVYPNSCS